MYSEKKNVYLQIVYFAAVKTFGILIQKTDKICLLSRKSQLTFDVFLWYNI